MRRTQSVFDRPGRVYSDADVARIARLPLHRLHALVDGGHATRSGADGWTTRDVDHIVRVAAWLDAGFPVTEAVAAANREAAS